MILPDELIVNIIEYIEDNSKTYEQLITTTKILRCYGNGFLLNRIMDKYKILVVNDINLKLKKYQAKNVKTIVFNFNTIYVKQKIFFGCKPYVNRVYSPSGRGYFIRSRNYIYRYADKGMAKIIRWCISADRVEYDGYECPNEYYCEYLNIFTELPSRIKNITLNCGIIYNSIECFRNADELNIESHYGDDGRFGNYCGNDIFDGITKAFNTKKLYIPYCGIDSLLTAYESGYMELLHTVKLSLTCNGSPSMISSNIDHSSYKEFFAMHGLEYEYDKIDDYEED